MKSFENVVFTIAGTEQSYMDLAKACVNNVGREGINVEEQRRRIKILDALDKSVGKITLEDAEMDKLKQLVESMPWALINKHIVAFSDAVRDAK